MKFIQLIAGIALVAVLAACGGGGGSPGANGTGTTTGTTTGTGATTGTTTGTGATPTIPTASPTGVVSVADYIFEMDKFSVKNSGSEKVLLSVTALDAARNIVPDVTVGVSVDSNAVFTQTAGAKTDATGKFTGSIGIGGDKTDRRINATITVNGIRKVATFAVTGTQISVTPLPAVPQPGQTLTLNIKVVDAGGVGIVGVPVQLSGIAGFGSTANTDFSGNLIVAAAAPVAESYVAVVAASGATVSQVISVVSPGSVNTITAAIGAFSGANLLANPSTIATSSGSPNRSVLTAKFIRANNTTIENMRVRFEIMPDALGAGEFISTGDSIVYSKADGVATADYVAGLRTSPTNGVKVRACFDYADFPPAPATYAPGSAVGSPSCPYAALGSLTVNSKPLAISIGNFNLLEKGLGGIAYVEKFLIQVADSSGVAVPDAVVSMSVDITHFGKGTFGGGYYITGSTPPTRQSLNYTNPLASDNLPATTATLTFPSGTGTQTTITSYTNLDVPRTTVDPVTGQIVANTVVWCVNEDRNRNGFNDTGEDINGNGLEPGKSEIVVSYVSGNKTDASGQMLVQVTYPQNMGSWLAYTLKATTSVVGSEGTKERAFITGVLQGDVPNGSFLTAPFGKNRCIDPN